MSDPAGQGSVRVELDDPRPGVAQDLPVPSGSSRRGSAMALFGVAVAAVAAIVFASRPESSAAPADAPVAVTTSVAVPEPDETAVADSASVSTSEFENVSEWTPQNGLVSSPTPADFGWLAMEGPRSGGRLVRSVDGLNWSRVDSDLPDDALLRVRRKDNDVYEALVRSSADLDGFAIDRWQSDDAVSWEQSGIAAFSGSGEAFAIFEEGDVTLVLAEAPSSEPIPAVSEVLTEFVSADIANRTCAVEPNGLLNFIIYDCSGGELARLDEVSNQVEDRIAFAGQVLRFRYSVNVSIDGGPQTTISLPPATSLVGISPAENGFLALVIDSSDAIADPVRLLTAGLFAKLHRYDVSGEMREIADAPVKGQPFGDQLLPGPGGRVYLSQTDGLHAADPPYDEWSVVAEGPTGDIPLGSEIRVLRGTDLLTFSDLNAGRIWVSREGGEWIRIDVPSGVVFESVLATEDYIIFRDFRGTRNELLRVDLEQPIGSG